MSHIGKRASSLDSNRFKPNVLLVTATKLETENLHKALQPPDGEKTLIKLHEGNHTYYLGTLGAHAVAHVQCTMGSLSTNGSTLTVSDAIQKWNPCVIIMVGIAFGVDEVNQQIGDVLISKSIVNYENQRVGAESTISRATPTPCGVTILNRFLNSTDWEHQLPSGAQSTASPGLLLSGEKLIDNIDYRNKLLEYYPGAIGGEMEGSGLAAAADSHHREWILVKGICDWADGKKSHDKKERQKIAVNAAISLCIHVLNNPTSLDGLAETKQEALQMPPDEEGALFVVYEPRFEQWYLERETDRRIAETPLKKHIWLWGGSGCGKTGALLRLGHTKFKNLVFVDLSAVVGQKLEILLEEIYWTLSEYLGISTNIGEKSPHVLLRSIHKIISDARLNDSLIVIDEFSGANQSDVSEFITLTSGLLLKLSNSPETRNNQIAIGSILSPLGINTHSNTKIHERVSVITIPTWTPEECRAWIDLVHTTIPWVKDEPLASDLIRESRGCPRRLKKLCLLHSKYAMVASWNLSKTINIHHDELLA